MTCYWAYPENYSHIAMRQIRRLDIVWQGNEADVYDKLKATAREMEEEMPFVVKEILEREMRRKRT